MKTNGGAALIKALELEGVDVIFGLPGAYTGTCTSAHVPSFIRTQDKLAAKGVDEVICLSVNDAFVQSGGLELLRKNGQKQHPSIDRLQF